MLLAIVAQRRTATNVALAAAAPRGVDARILVPEQAASLLQPGAVALGRLDVVDGLDGVEDGLWALGSLAARGVVVLNRAGALLAAHDKLLTAKVLQRAGLPHPRTRILHPGGHVPDWEGPVVVKPRFGSWGRDVELCEDEISFRRHLRSLEHRLWFQRPRRAACRSSSLPPATTCGSSSLPESPSGRSRASQRPASGARTSRSAGCAFRSIPPQEALDLAVRAAAASGAELLGVDLLPDGVGGYTVLELNGAVDFTREYRIDRDPFVAAAAELTRHAWEPEEAVA